MNDITIKDGVGLNKSGGLDITHHKDEYDDVIKFFQPTLNNNVFTTRGISVFFGHRLATPETFTPIQATKTKTAIRTLIKNYPNLNPNEKEEILQLIKQSIQKLNEYRPINSFDMIVSVKSTAPLNKILLTELKSYLKPDGLMIDDMFAKDVIENLDLDWEMLDREPSEKTKEMVLAMYEKVMKTKNLFFIKDLKSSVRRYFIKFLKFSDDVQKDAFDHIFGKNILLVDDTVGEVATFRDMIRLISTYKPKEYLCYAFLRDY